MRKILSIVLMVCIIIIICSGCSSKIQHVKQEEVIEKLEVKVNYLEVSLTDNDSNYSIISKGNYYLFSCKSSDEYVIFLGDLDENVYEIVDTQIEHFTDANFFVTYKKK